MLRRTFFFRAKLTTMMVFRCLITIATVFIPVSCMSVLTCLFFYSCVVTEFVEVTIWNVEVYNECDVPKELNCHTMCFATCVFFSYSTHIFLAQAQASPLRLLLLQIRRLKIKLYFYAEKNYFSPHRKTIEKVTRFLYDSGKSLRINSLHSNILSEAVHDSHKVLILSKNNEQKLRT